MTTEEFAQRAHAVKIATEIVTAMSETVQVWPTITLRIDKIIELASFVLDELPPDDDDDDLDDPEPDDGLAKPLDFEKIEAMLK